MQYLLLIFKLFWEKFKKTDTDNFDLEQYQDTLNGKC